MYGRIPIQNHKAKEANEAPASHEVRLTPLDTSQYFNRSLYILKNFQKISYTFQEIYLEIGKYKSVDYKTWKTREAIKNALDTSQKKPTKKETVKLITKIT